MKPYRRFIDSIARTRWFGWFGQRMLAPMDKRIGHRVPLTFGAGLPVVRLVTTGRRTGEPRTSVLLYVTMPSGDLAVAGSNFGSGDAPAWTYNLDADPNATISIDGSAPEAVTAVRAASGEAPAIWAALDDVWPAFAAYRSRTTRDIPLYVLTRVDGGAQSRLDS